MRRFILATAVLVGCAGPIDVADNDQGETRLDVGRTDAQYIKDAQADGRIDAVIDAARTVDHSVTLDTGRNDGGSVKVDLSILPDSQVLPVDAAVLPVDAAVLPDVSPPSPDFGVLDFILVRPAANSRTILPHCINGVDFEEFEPPCFRNSRGVSFGEIYAVEYRFRDNIGAFTGDLIMDETGGGGYDLSLSTRPGDMNPPSEGCHSLFGGFGQLRYIDLEAAEAAGDGRMIGGRDGIIVDPLEGLCVVDKADVYYLNVHVVDARCDALNRNTARCSPIILQDAGSLDL